MQVRKRQVLKKQPTPAQRKVGAKEGNGAQGADRRTPRRAGSDNREPHAGGAPQNGFGCIGEVTGLPALAECRAGPAGSPDAQPAGPAARGSGSGEGPTPAPPLSSGMPGCLHS